MVNAVSEGTGDDKNREGRKDYTDKPDPIREKACIWCMACVTGVLLYQLRSMKLNLPVY